MAIIQNPIIGSSTGKMANVVFSRSFGKNILRSKALTVRNPNSDAQRAQRSFLSTVGLIAKQSKSMLLVGFANDVTSRSAYSSALKSLLATQKEGATDRLKYPSFDALVMSNGYLTAPVLSNVETNAGSPEVSFDIALPVVNGGSTVKGDLYVMACRASGPFSQSISNIDEYCDVECIVKKVNIALLVGGTYSGTVNFGTVVNIDDKVSVTVFQVDPLIGIGRNGKTGSDSQMASFNG